RGIWTGPGGRCLGRTGGATREVAADPKVRGHRERPRSSGAAAALALGGNAATGVAEDLVQHATEGEDHDDDQRGDTGDQTAALTGRRTALVHLGLLGVEHDAEVVHHFVLLQTWRLERMRAEEA